MSSATPAPGEGYGDGGAAVPPSDAVLLDRLRRALGAAGHDPTPGELGDLLWLALHTPPPGRPPGPPEPVPPAAPAPAPGRRRP
ncbi:hypothetical protein ABT160_18130, partial [Streptomyces sp. NPDC001941]